MRNKKGQFIKGHISLRKGKGENIKIICQTCKQQFKVRPYRKNIAKYCCIKCKPPYWKDKKRSKETIEKISITKKGTHSSPKTEFKKGNIPGNYKNGRIKTTGGYIQILQPNHPFSNYNGYILEHRLILEKKIGRYLKPTEVSHHINGIKNDNRPENLILFNNISEHVKYHFIIKK